jgi:hypothetical protein
MSGATITFYWAVVYDSPTDVCKDFPECGQCTSVDEMQDLVLPVEGLLPDGMCVIGTDFESNGYCDGTHTDEYDHYTLVVGYPVGEEYSIHYNGVSAVPDIPQTTRDTMSSFLAKRGITLTPLLYVYAEDCS